VPRHDGTPERYEYDARGGVLTTDVLRYALDKRPGDITKPDEMRVADVLRSLGYERGPRVTENGARVRRYTPGPPGQPSPQTAVPTRNHDFPASPQSDHLDHLYPRTRTGDRQGGRAATSGGACFWWSKVVRDARGPLRRARARGAK